MQPGVAIVGRLEFLCLHDTPGQDMPGDVADQVVGRQGLPGVDFLHRDSLGDFLAMHRDVFWRLRPDADLVALNAEYRDGYLVADLKGFANTAG